MNKLTHAQIAELVIQAQQGDQQAFAALYTATVDSQLYFATAFLKDPLLAEDAVQDVYMKMFRSIDKLQNPKVFVAYLNRICYNTCVDYRKKHLTQNYELDEDKLMKVKDTDPVGEPSNYLEMKESNRQLYDALSDLPEQLKEAFLLRHYHNMKIRDVSKTMEISESTVKRYIKAAEAALKEALSNPMITVEGR